MARDLTGRTLSTWRQYATVLGAVLAGVQGVVILIVSNQALTTEQFAPLAQLWAIWAVSAAALNYGFQQWSAVHPVGIGLLGSRQGLPVVLALGVIGLVVFSVTTATRGVLFSSQSLWWPVFASILPLGTAAVGINRGELARTGRPLYLALVIGSENTLRLAATLVLAVLNAPPETFGLALLLGFGVCLIPPSRQVTGQLTAVRPLVMASGAGLASHALLFGAPLILAVGGGEPSDVVLLFLVLSAVRAPFVLLQGLIPQLAVRFGRQREAAHSTIKAICLTGVSLAALAFCLGLALGDTTVGFTFSIRGELSQWVYAVIAATAMISIALSLITVQLVADDHLTPLLAGWTLPIVATSAAILAGMLDDIHTVAFWILVCHMLSLIVIVAVSERQSRSVGHARAGVTLRPDMPHPPSAAP